VGQRGAPWSLARRLGLVSSRPVPRTSPDTAPVHLLDSDETISRAAARIGAESELSLDTEFHSERRYHPELMLLQVCAPSGETWLADPRSADVGPVIRAVSTRPVVVHAGQQDLAILQREADAAPKDLLDVQIGAGLLGLGYPTRLSVVAEAVLGRPMAKAATLSDWAKRPLSEAQLHYAVEDVRILLPLAERMRVQLEERGHLGFARTASEELATRSTRPASTNHKWTDWDIAPQMDEPTRTTLQAIFEWRDARGRDKDQPPHYMLSDGLALDVARRRPESVEALASNRRFPGGLVRRFGQDMVGVVRQAQFIHLEPIHIPTQKQRGLADALELWARLQEAQTGIAAKLAMPRRVALAVAKSGSAELRGWRAEALSEPIEALLTGRTSIFLGPDTTEVR
jgi:ribonuclease D